MQILTIKQYEPEWWQARLGLPTVSEFSRFITPKRGDLSAQADGYIADLIVEQVEGLSEQVQSYWMERGITMEEQARAWYEFEYDCDVERVGLILNKGAGWSPDGLVGPKGAVEIKCPKPSTHVKWLLTGGIPDEHKPQAHGALSIGERDWVDFVSYCPGYRKLVVRVTPDEYTEKVDAALKAFLEKYEAAKLKMIV